MKPVIVANWKMQLGQAQSVERLTALRIGLKDFGYQVHVVVCPTFTALERAKETLITSKIQLGAQDMFWAEQGAFTGEVSPTQLKEIGVSHVILGHSERREFLGETDSMVAQKVESAMAHGLTPIICVGETAHQRNDNIHEMVIVQQLERALQCTTPPSENQMVLVAYEPMWAIGTGEPAAPVQAELMRQVIVRTLQEKFGPELTAHRCGVLYGGSVDAQNITNYVRPDSYNGALVGGAGLQPESFMALLTSVKQQFI